MNAQRYLYLPVFVALFICSLLSNATDASAKVRVSERTTYYSVSGKTGAQLFKSIQRRSPSRQGSNHAIALTTTKIRFSRFRVGMKGRRCGITSGDIVMKLTYTYPRWRGAKRASPKVRKNWNRFYKQLKKHERQHGTISKDFAKKLNAMFARVGRSARNCRQFKKRSLRQIKKLERNWRRSHARFDRRESRARSRIRRLQGLVAKSN